MKKSSLLLLIVPFLLTGCLFTKKEKKQEEQHIYESSRSAKLYLTDYYSLNTSLYEMKGISNDIPYVDFTKTYNNLFSLIAASYSGDQFGYSLTASLEGEKVKMTISNVNNLMLLLSRGESRLIVANGLETNYVSINESLTNDVVPDGEVTFDLGKYNIDIMSEEKTVYVPLATFTDLFLSLNSIPIVYNGKDLYFANTFGNNPSGIGAEDLELKYFQESPWNGQQRSQELATFTYQEMCMALDYLYGLKDFRNIQSFDALLTSSGWKNGLLSTNPDTYERTMIDFVNSYLCEGHTNYTKISSFNYGTDYTALYNETHNENERYTGLLNDKDTLTSARENAGEGIGLSIFENTAIIRFDQFVKAGQDTSSINPDYFSYSQLHEADTYLFFKKAFNDIKNNSQVEKVVIDITCNGGGMLDAIPWLEAFMTDDPFFTVRSSLSGQVTDVHYKVDLNQDGTFDENDTYKNQYDFYLLTSNFSFSCGNAFPTVIKKSGMATIIGEISGGGACAVGTLTTASGTILRLSSTLQMGSLDSDNQFVINESGITPDYTFDRAKFYQNYEIKSFVNNL